MSYILDALKKANAERETGRGTVPGLHTQPVQGMSESPAQLDVALKKRNALLLALVAALFLCTATMGALLWPVLKAPAPLPAPHTTTLAPPVMANASPTSPSITTAATATTATTGSSSAPAVPVRVTPAPYNISPPTSVPPEPVRQESPSAPPRPRLAPTQPLTPVAPPLPANVRSALPPLVISGSTYSDNPAYRMLIINGQVYREGEFPAPELKLEQIRQKSALLSYKGNTYALPY